MTSGCDEVEECVYAIVSEARVTLDARLFCEDVIVLTLEVSHDFREARQSTISDCEISISPDGHTWLHCRSDRQSQGYRQWSVIFECPLRPILALKCVSDQQRQLARWFPLTDSDGLDSHSLLQMCAGWIIGIFASQHSLSA